LNDLFLMVFHGALRQLAARWLGSGSDAAVNRALPTGEMATNEPSRVLESIATSVRAHPDWIDALRDPDPALLDRLRDDASLSELWRAIDAYLNRWGDRSPEELQLDRPSYREDPLPLMRAIADLASRSI